MDKDVRRKAIIEEVQCTLENMEASALLIGNEEDQHCYADAIIGVLDEPRVAVLYDGDKVIEALMEMNDWDWETLSTRV